MNLQTGKTEAKLLDPNEDKSAALNSLQPTESKDSKHSDFEESRNRLEDALKNFPAEKFDDVIEEKWKEISKQFRSYEKIMEELKDIDLNPKTGAEVLKQLMDEYIDQNSDATRKLDILKDIEFLMHSIDNSLLFLSSGGVESILIPNLVNQTEVTIRVTLLKLLGTLLQNNQQAKKYVSERTSLGHEIVSLMSKSEHIEELSASLYACGSLLRNNMILSTDIFKKSIAVMLEILTKSTVNLSIKSKDLTLISDLVIRVDEQFVKSQKICEKIATFFDQQRNSLVMDADAMDKVSSALLEMSNCHHKWAETAMFRHTLLVLGSNFKSRLIEEVDEDVKYMFELVVEKLEQLNMELYGNFKIRDDDLSKKYHERDEL